jgi:thiosulfate dehydrogenase
MMRARTPIIAAVAGLALVLAGAAVAADQAAPTAAADTTIEIELCDGETTTRVPATVEHTRESGQKIADALMSEWLARHPERGWTLAAAPRAAAGGSEGQAPAEGGAGAEVATEKEAATADPVALEREKHAIRDPFDNSTLIGRGQGATYGKITEMDVALWQRETLKVVAEGSRIFHSPQELGSSIAVSCDMCHPDASNTHAETYPKYQVQLNRVALLRDMINWCIEHPVRGKPLTADDARMRALEAYIFAQRSGTPLAYGKR